MANAVCLPPARPQVFELYGLPGAGKTTLADALEPALAFTTRADLSSKWRALPLWRQSGFVASTVTDREWIAALSALVRAAPVRRAESLFRLARLAVNKPWLRGCDGRVVLDQGLLQRLWSIFFTEGILAPPHRQVAQLIGSFYGGVEATIVSLEISPDIAAQRVHGRWRGSSRFDELEKDAVLAQLSDNCALTAAILAAARDAGVGVVELDGTAPPADLAAQLGLLIDEARSGPRVAA